MAALAPSTVIWVMGRNSNETGVRISVTEHSERIRSLFEKCRQSLERFLRARVSPDEAREVAQEAFLRLLALPEGKAVENWEAVLFKTAGNIAHTRNGQRLTHEKVILQLQAALDDSPTLESTWSKLQDLAAIRKAVAELPERQRQILTLRAKGLTHQQIAQELGIGERTSRRDYQLAILEIREKIGLGNAHD
jgi:RNA polymerase sigma factor (sigma-70 family)